MKTDESLYEIFCQHPEWIADMLNEPTTAPGTFSSPIIKKSERRLDGLLVPANSKQPVLVIEFQFFHSADIYLRAAEQRIAVHRLYPKREVGAVIFFANKSFDKRPYPWTHVVRAVYLDEEMAVLAMRNPAHPLPKLLAPIFEKDETTLESQAAMVYRELGRVQNLSKQQLENLRAIYTSLLFSRFKNRTSQEINAMIRTFDLTKTRAGRELMDLGKTEGRTETLLKILAKRLGKLPKTVVSQIEHLNYIQLEKLEDIVLDVPTVAELSAWLRKLKPQR